jgi:hypothetical protein
MKVDIVDQNDTQNGTSLGHTALLKPLSMKIG